MGDLVYLNYEKIHSFGIFFYLEKLEWLITTEITDVNSELDSLYAADLTFCIISEILSCLKVHHWSIILDLVYLVVLVTFIYGGFIEIELSFLVTKFHYGILLSCFFFYRFSVINNMHLHYFHFQEEWIYFRRGSKCTTWMPF